MAKAYCFANGEIGVCSGEENEPEGSVVFAEHEDEAALRCIIEARARLARDGKTYLVPGAPEAKDQEAAMDALIAWEKWAFPPGWDEEGGAETIEARKWAADFVESLAKLSLQQRDECSAGFADIANAVSRAVSCYGFFAGTNLVFDVWSSVMVTAAANNLIAADFDPAAHVRRIADEVEASVNKAKAGLGNVVAQASITDVLAADALRHAAPAGSA
jgi:hypothetical protein